MKERIKRRKETKKEVVKERAKGGMRGEASGRREGWQRDYGNSRNGEKPTQIRLSMDLSVYIVLFNKQEAAKQLVVLSIEGGFQVFCLSERLIILYNMWNSEKAILQSTGQYCSTQINIENGRKFCINLFTVKWGESLAEVI